MQPLTRLRQKEDLVWLPFSAMDERLSDAKVVETLQS